MAGGLTTGIKNALAKRDHRCMCKECGFALPKYPGRYPSKCPSCGEALPTQESLVEARVGACVTLRGEPHTIVEIDEGVAYCEGPGGVVEVPIG